ncbi:glycosyltransferase family 2 protein [Tahibacter sp.]|uniref:glycosyltransferase family 2 protein n=1 Tax=Tahibacter sp. TaxID=2056211 RepID=UPI0028C46E0D|nr:glycosyltransferase family 2 protein [Tahibacter sp.]
MEVTDIVSKLYLPEEGGGYSEDCALTVVAEAVDGARVRVRFRFDVERVLSRVRFDPVASPGVGQLHRVEWRVENAAGTHTASYAAEELRDVARVSYGVELPPDRAGGLAFWAVNGDPQLELLWPEALCGADCAVELVLHWSFDPVEPEENDVLTRALLDQLGFETQQGEVPPPPPTVEERISQIAGRVLALADGQGATARGQAELDQRTADLRAKLDMLQNQHIAVCGTLGDAVSAQDEQADEIARLRESQQSLEEQLVAAQAQAQERLLAAEQALGMLGPLQDRLIRVEQHSPENIALRKRERTHRRLLHWRRQTLAWTDLVHRYRLVCDPLGDLTLLGGGEPAHWKGTGSDPRFLVRWGGRAGPTSGWYLFDAHCRSIAGGFADPCLYVDYGDGMTEEARIPLSLDVTVARQTCLIKFDRDLIGLRFDPSKHPCEFELGRATLRKLSRVEAAARMAVMGLRPIRQSPAAIRRAIKDAWNVFRREGFRGVEQRLRQVGEASAGRFDYEKWARCYDMFGEADRERAQVLIAAMPRRPKFSIVMPVYNTPEQWLELCIQSVIGQFYTNWELCIADDASTQPHVRAMLQRYAAQDSRIKVCFRENNGHIVHASNSALELADGEYIVLLDHDDELAPHALFMCAHALNERPQLKLIYSDEDKIDEQGRRFDPYFKPDWNPDLFRSQNMISHLGVYSAELVRAVGGFRPGFEGSQDYDLALRCIETLQAQEIGHVPHVLYHWRAIPGSTALTSDAKSYARSAGVLALESHFARRGIAASVEETTGGNYRVTYPLPAEPLPLVSLVIPTRDRVDLLRVCVDGLLNGTDYPNLEIIIANNQSSEAETLIYFEQLRSDPRVRVVDYDEPFSFSGINNYAVAQARGEIIGLINNDIEVIEPGWLREMVSHAVRPEIGAVGAMLYFPDDRIQHAGVILGLGGIAGHAYLCKPRNSQGQMNRACVVQNLSCVTAACLLLRKSVYDEVHGLDEGLRVAFNDTDFCLRIREAGYRNLWSPWAQLYHHESASRGQEDSPEKLARFNGEVDFMRKRWGDMIEQDPAYNPNLSLTIESFALSWPPRVVYPFRAGVLAAQ